MNYQEAIKILKSNKPTSDPRQCGKELCTACDVAISAMNELQAFHKIGALEEVREAVEKQNAKKIKIWNGQAMCPNCSKLFGNMNDIKKLIVWEMPYCKFCGQAIDWGEEE